MQRAKVPNRDYGSGGFLWNAHALIFNNKTSEVEQKNCL